MDDYTAFGIGNTPELSEALGLGGSHGGMFAGFDPGGFMTLLQDPTYKQNLANLAGSYMPPPDEVFPFYTSADTGVEAFNPPPMTLMTEEEQMRNLSLGPQDNIAVAPAAEMLQNVGAQPQGAEAKTAEAAAAAKAAEKKAAMSQAMLKSMMQSGQGQGQLSAPGAVNVGPSPVEIQRAVAFLKQSSESVPMLGKLLMGG